MLNVFENVILHKTQIFDHKNPDWMNKSTALSLQRDQNLQRDIYAIPTDYNKEMLPHQVSECTKLIVETKDKHLAKLSSKLGNPDAAPKTYWSIVNRFLNNKKTPIIPPVFFEGKLISDFEKKAEFYNNHFTSQCYLFKMQIPYQTLNIKPMSD